MCEIYTPTLRVTQKLFFYISIRIFLLEDDAPDWIGVCLNVRMRRLANVNPHCRLFYSRDRVSETDRLLQRGDPEYESSSHVQVIQVPTQEQCMI